MKTIKKNLFCVILVLALCLSAVPAQAAALWESPAEPATRQMVSTALWQMEGAPVVNYILPFTDVSQEAEYAEAVRWAASEQIVNGVGGGLFLPDSAVSREQLAAMLYRYAKGAGMDVSAGEDTTILSYADSFDWSDWAVEPLRWAAGSGLLDAKDGGRLDARGTVTQAETAAILETFTALPASPTDYSDAANWAYYGIGAEKEADLFLVCPTVDMKDEYNMGLDDAGTKESFLGALNMERGIYEDSTRMYAPYYRQAAMKVYGLDRAAWEPYMEIAYSDVSAAFSYYLEHENQDRPIILAGFSQGADMCYRLLEEYFGDEELQNRLVAVYAIGWPLTVELTRNSPQIVPAKSSDDTGVVVSFDCEAPEVTETFISPAGRKAYAINPLNWKTDGTAADKSENLGACFTDYSGGIRSEVKELCGCYIDGERGVLKVTDIDAEDYSPVVPGLPEGAYHVYDYQFFFRNLQRNVAERVAAYLEQPE